MDKFECYWKFSETEQRFNESAAGVRTLASGWILAALAALGWLLQPGGDFTWAIPLGLLLCAVCTLAVAGVATLWVLDQVVYHQLLNAVFLVGLKLECAEPSLPPIRAMMMKNSGDRGTQRWEVLFYLGPILVFVVLSAVVVIAGPDTLFAVNRPGGVLQIRWVGDLLLLAQLVIVVGVLLKQRSLDFERRAEWFGDPEFKAIVSHRTFEDIIKASSFLRSTPANAPAPSEHDPASR